MDVPKLKAFYETVQGNGFGVAARVLKLSEAGVRKQVRVLEKELGHALFTNISHRLVLTEKGKRFFEYAAKILKLIREAETDLSQDYQEQLSVTIFTTYAIATNFLVEALTEHLHDFKGEKVSVLMRDHLPDMQSGNYPICIWNDDIEPNDYIKLPLVTFEMGLYASEDYIKQWGLPQRADDLNHHRLIAYPEEVPYPYNEVNWFLNAFQPLHPPYLQMNSGVAILKAIQEGIGIGSLSAVGAALAKVPLTKILPTLKGPSVQIYFYYNPSLIADCYAKDLFTSLKEFFSAHGYQDS